LHIEDSERDAALVARHLLRAGYELVADRVDTRDAMKATLETRQWDVILCDYSMPQFNALAALALIKELELDVPFIIISGTVGEGLAVESMQAGANDYVMKDNLVRLVPAIERETNEAANRQARRQAEDQLRLQSAALEAAANGIVITDTSGKIIWVNPAFTQSTGYSQEEVLGQNPRLLKSGKQSDSFYRNMWETILAGQVWRNTIVNQRKDGTLNREDMTITPIRNTGKKITHFVAIKQDITQLENALSEVNQKREELAAMTQQLWQASKLATMGELSASVAHELNNPLATISLHLEVLTGQLSADAPNRRPLQVIEHEVERMAVLVSNLLLFSRRSHQQISTINMAEELQSSLEFINYHLCSRRINVVTDFANDLPSVQADRQQLRQLFLNLLTNASDAMPEGGTMTIRASRDTLANGAPALLIEFSDTGIGIEPEDMPKLWEPFFTTKPEGKGTGLGLPICRRTVEEHRGTIDIESLPGKGTTVRIILPATETEIEKRD